MFVTYNVFAEWGPFNMSMYILARDPDEALHQMWKYLKHIYEVDLKDVRMRIL
jgi:hypothetical protein